MERGKIDVRGGKGDIILILKNGFQFIEHLLYVSGTVFQII